MIRHLNTIIAITLFMAVAGWVTGDTVRGSAAPKAQECEYHVSPTRIDLPGPGQSGVVQVDTAPGCAWTATDDSDWLSITSGASGTGPGSISYAVSTMAPSQDFPIRQGHILVRWNTPTLGQNVQVTQSTGPCNAWFYPAPGQTSPQTFGARGGGGHLWVLAESFMNGPWLVAGAPDWITLTSPPLTVVRKGDGDVFFAVSPNPSSAPRDGTLTFCNGQTMDVHQSGSTPYQGPFVPGDFDGDGRADLSVFRPGTGEWFVLQSHSGYSYSNALAYQWGQAGAMPVPGDFDGDARTDLAVYQPQGLYGSADAGNWNLRYSSNDFAPATKTSFAFGTRFDPQAVPLLADFSGDGKQDYVQYAPSRGEWNIYFTSVGVPGGGWPFGSMLWGLPGDVPVPADFDGDGKADVAVWRPSSGTWFVRYSSNGYSVQGAAAFQWGVPGDVPQPIDFDGDKKADLVVWRPSEGRWFILYASTGYTQSTSYQWGGSGDIPMANDYDGDGRADLAVWRPSNGTWYLLLSSAQYRYDGARSVQWGLPGDRPVGPTAPARRFGLNLTLTQGEGISSYHSGTVTGPNGFTCTLGLSDTPVTCPPQYFEEGTSVQLLVTLINPFPGARPINSVSGCDARTSNTCTVVMNGQRNVTIGIGCEVSCSGLSGAEPSLQAERAVHAPRRIHEGREARKDR